MEADRASMPVPRSDAELREATSNGIGSSKNGADSARTANLVPIDRQVVVGDNFVATPEKKTHFDKANQSLAKGQSKAAMDELKLADIEVELEAAKSLRFPRGSMRILLPAAQKAKWASSSSLLTH